MKNYKYDGSRKFSIKNFDCADKGEFNERHETIEEFTENLEKINEYQQKLFAERKEGIIFVFQAMDAAGKDGAVRAVLSCLSPQGVSEHSFKVPSSEENSHDYLWRFWKAIPEKGTISIFNRSYYEDVLVQKIHKIYEKNRYADRIDLSTMIDKRYEQIRNFEKYLWENSIRVVKIFLNVSKDEQARRFISRIDTQKKNWKFSSSDIDERQYWDEYMQAYETCINRTARKNTPWYVVPADHKWYARLVISRIVLNELEAMDPQWPVLEEEEVAKLQSYRERLMAEKPQIAPEEEESGKKVKPSDTAVGIALKSDRMALSEKKFRKLLKKSIFENFSERFGVSEKTQEDLGRAYFQMEEIEAKAEADDLDAVKSLAKANKTALEEALQGCGKEGRKLQERFKKACREQVDGLIESINQSYGQYEEDLKQLMIEYELAVGNGEASPEEALTVYEEKLRAAFEAHRCASEESRSMAETELTRLFEQYVLIADDFPKAKEEKKAKEKMAAEAEDELACECSAEEAPAEECAEECCAEAEEACECIEAEEPACECAEEACE